MCKKEFKFPNSKFCFLIGQPFRCGCNEENWLLKFNSLLSPRKLIKYLHLHFYFHMFDFLAIYFYIQWGFWIRWLILLSYPHFLESWGLPCSSSYKGLSCFIWMTSNFLMLESWTLSQFYIQLFFKPHLGTWILPFGQPRQPRQ